MEDQQLKGINTTVRSVIEYFPLRSINAPPSGTLFEEL